MAFTLQIRQKKLFKKTILDIPSLARDCGFRYGSVDDFYILREGEFERGAAIFYNPERIGRGIFFNGSKAGNGLYEVQYSIPTTTAEIADFTRLVREIENRLGKTEMYCVEEERTFTSEELERDFEKFVLFSLKSLNQFCQNEEYQNYIFPLALWPYTLTEDKVTAWRVCTDLSDFEQTIHELQTQDVYYARPRLFQNNDTKEINAFYALTEECSSVFPVHADGFLNLDQIEITEGFVQFVLYSEKRMLDGTFSYDRFIEELKEYDVRRFDATHILIPPLNKENLENLAAKLR